MLTPFKGISKLVLMERVLFLAFGFSIREIKKKKKKNTGPRNSHPIPDTLMGQIKLVSYEYLLPSGFDHP